VDSNFVARLSAISPIDDTLLVKGLGEYVCGCRIEVILRSKSIDPRFGDTYTNRVVEGTVAFTIVER